MFKINGTTITLTKGDSFYCQIALKKNGTAYTPQEGDEIRFAMKQSVYDTTPAISKVIPNDTLILHLAPSDTKQLAVGKYVYDIEITFADTDVDTFINQAEFNLVPEVLA